MGRFLVCSLLFCLARAQDPVFRYIDNNETAEDCTDCLTKCCPGAQILLEIGTNTSCVDNLYNLTKLEDFHVDIYNNDVADKVVKSEKTLKSFKYMYGDVYWDSRSEIKNNKAIHLILYLLENGSLALRFINSLEQWPYPAYTAKYHCLEVQATATRGLPDPGSVRLVHRVRFEEPYPAGESGDEYMDLKNNIIVGAMLISSVFLLLTLITYAALPQKRNLPTLMMMTFAACMMTAFIFRAIQVLSEGQFDKSWCTFVGVVLYYTLWCCFTWMNVMSYDVWTTACTMLQPRSQPRRQILAKLACYAVYGFGVPLLLMAFMVGVDFADLASTPYFVKPHFVASPYCYFEKETERRLYILTPILVATVANTVFFTMTSLYIWRHSARPGGCGDSRNTKKDKNRFAIYVKLTLITGITWILDVVSAFLSPGHWAWLVADVLNSSTGLFIFYSFVCKREIFLLLCKRFGIKSRAARRWESTVVTSLSVTKRQLSDQESGPN